MEFSCAAVHGYASKLGLKEKVTKSSELEEHGTAGLWDCDTPKVSRKDATSSPFVATPSAPQRIGRSSRGGAELCRSATGAGINSPTACINQQFRQQGTRETPVIELINKDLLVITIEEENERLRGALDAERRARQLAEAEAAAQQARARDLEQRAQDLSFQLAEVRVKLVTFEQEAFSRALVQTWLETATGHRRGSMDHGPEDYVAEDSGSPPYMEARLRMKLPTSGPKAGVEVDGEYASALVNVRTEPVLQATSMGAETCEAARSLPLNNLGLRIGGLTDELCGDTELAYDADVELPFPESFAPVLAGENLFTSCPHTSVRAGGVGGSFVDGTSACGCISNQGSPQPPAYSVHHLSRRTATGGAADITGGQSVANLLERACLAVDGSRTDAAGAWSPSGWSIPPIGDSGAQLPLQSERSQPPPDGVDVDTRTGEQATAMAAATVWMPTGQGFHTGLGLQASQESSGPLTLRLSAARSAAVRPATTLSEFQQSLAGAHSAPIGGGRCSPHLHPAPWLGGSVRVADRSRLLKLSGSALLRGASDAGACDSGAIGVGAGMPVCGLAPVGFAQDGGEWCNIPLGSPVCTPKRGASRPGQA